MSDEFSRPSGIDWNSGGTYGQVKFGDDSGLAVMFYSRSVRNEIKSREQNKPWFDNVDHVRINQPGERLNQIDRPVQEVDKHRFPRQWGQYINKKAQTPEGTPIDMLFPNNPALADILKGMGIYTVQQASKLNSYGIDAIGMGGQEVVNKAQTYLKESDNGAAYNKLRKELSDKDQQIRLLQSNQEKQRRLIDELYARVGGPGALAPLPKDLNPPYIPGYDAQTERINANHMTAQVAEAKKKAKKKVQPMSLPVIEVGEDATGNEFMDKDE